VVIPERHEMDTEYRGIAASVHALAHMDTIPRSVSPVALGQFALRTAHQSRAIGDIARNVGAKLIHTFNEAYLAGNIAARRLNIPAVMHIIGMSVFTPPVVAATYSRLLDRTSDRIVCCQGEIRRRLVSNAISTTKLDVVYNSVSVNQLWRDLEAQPGPVAEPDTLRVGMIAGLDPRKGHLDLVAAAQMVCRQVPEARFFVVGSIERAPKYLDQIREAIDRAGLSDRFTLVGSVLRTAPWIHSFDVYCIPSRTEALSVAGVEAMALGKPIVATRVGGNPEAVMDGETGLLCAPADPEDLAAKLLALLRDPSKRTHMGEAGKKRASEIFSSEANVDRLAAVFRRAIGN
jgi:glycosyltransferase involved in cell wall biosynthesis